jgi:hypothetical protein
MEHEAAIVAACAKLGTRTSTSTSTSTGTSGGGGSRVAVHAVLACMGTAEGIHRHALHREHGSIWHFLDPGRYYLAQAVLSVMLQAATAATAESSRE